MLAFARLCRVRTRPCRTLARAPIAAALVALAGCSEQDAADQGRESPESRLEIFPSALPSATAPPSPPLGGARDGNPPASLRAAAADAGTTCGSAPGADCPLQGWMKTSVSVPLAERDFVRIEQAFLQLAKMAPPDYAHWAFIARDGADAARIEHLDAVRAACRGCHGQYLSRYRRDAREKPLF